MQNNEQETIYDSAAIKKIAVRVSWVSIIVNALLSLG